MPEIVWPFSRTFMQKILNLVVGGDIFSLTTYVTLCEKYGRENVLILNPRPIIIEDLKVQGPSTLRGLADRKSVV